MFVLLALGVFVASVAFIIFVPALFLLPYLASQGILMNDSDAVVEFAKTDPTAIFLQMIAIVPAHILTLLVAWLVVSGGRKFSFRDTLGWQKGGVRWWHYCIMLGGFFIIAAAVGTYFPEQENDLLRILKSSRSAVYIVAFVATFTAPLVEEVIYRGILYSAFERLAGVQVAFLVVTILFASVHVPQYYPSYSTIFLLTLLSVMLTLVRVKSGNLLPCIILHTLFNGLQSALLVIEPLISKPATQEQMASLFSLLQ